MISFATPVALLVLVPLTLLTVWVWRTSDDNLGPRRRLSALVLRTLILLAVILGLAGAELRLPQGREATIFVADLSASDVHDRSTMQEFINSADSARPSGDLDGVVSVAGNAAVEQPASPWSSFDGFQASLNQNATNLQRGLDLGGAVMPSGYRGRVVLLSDGRQTAGDVTLAAGLLRARGIRVDVVPARVRGGPDVRVERTSAPSSLRTAERFSLTVTLHSNVSTSTRLDIYRDHALVLSRDERVHAGDNVFSFPQNPLRRGFHSYSVEIAPRIDSQPGNNTGGAFTIVAGPPRVLVIAATPGEATNVVDGLRSTGISADLRKPEQVEPALAFLQQYAAIVVVDTAAEQLGPTLSQQLVPYVRDLGHGLVVLGGQRAYGLGGYGHTPLEQVLPVSMELPDRPDLPSVGVVLIIESLEANYPINISKAAGKGVVQLLTEEDRIAVNEAPDQNGPEAWVVRLQPARAKGTIDRAIDGMQPGDPQSYVPVLRSAANVLRGSKTRLRHIILLGDGDAYDRRYKSVARAIHKQGITISTVITNGQAPADFATMRTLARAGGGRYYRANSASKVPAIFLHEARTVARSGIITGTFYPRVLSASPLIRDLHPMPPLNGYVAVTPKPQAQVILGSKKTDPILASWQFGLGRSVAWTSDSAGLWTRRFVSAPHTNRFWADLVSWTLPSSQGNQLYVGATTHGGEARIRVDTPSDVGSSPTVTARVVGPNLDGATVRLQPSAPGKYTGAFPAAARGAYFVSLQAEGSGHGATGQGGVVVPYPAEYRTSGTDMASLRAIARAGGGTVIHDPGAVWSDSLPAIYENQPLSALLWLVALLLLPIDIAVRRLIVTRRDVATARAILGRIKKAQAA